MRQKQIQHLYWRASFGIDFIEIENLKSTSKSKVVSNLFSKSDHVPLELDLSEFSEIKFKSKKELQKSFTEEELQKLRNKQQKKVRDLNNAWVDRLSSSNSLLREKMTLFWANVLVCRDNDIFFIQRYNNVLRKNALGDFRQFVKEIAKEPSISKYLNNKQNVKENLMKTLLGN